MAKYCSWPCVMEFCWTYAVLTICWTMNNYGCVRMKSLQDVDWGKLPTPQNDGQADHLLGFNVPMLMMQSTDGQFNVGRLIGYSVLFFHPMIGHPNKPLPDGWDDFPGARGCTPQSCAYRTALDDLHECGLSNILGVSTQSLDEQHEAIQRLGLSYPLISDFDHKFMTKLKMPCFELNGVTRYKRLTMVLDGRKIIHVRYPVFPPDQDAQTIVDWMRNIIV